MDLTPIDTEYKGCYFRSRLEARWAVFFEKMGWDWRYEAEGFKLPSGNYLPDFYFPELNIYAEVKPRELNKTEFKLAQELTDILCKEKFDVGMLILEGDLDFKSYRVLQKEGDPLDVIPMPKFDKFYPFFFASKMDRSYTHETAQHIKYARQARFEFEWKEK